MEITQFVGQALTMSSREIAEMCGTTHDSMLKSIRLLKEKGLVSENESTYLNTQNGHTYPEFRLNFRDTILVVSGFSAEVRAKIIDRWQELESKHVTPPQPAYRCIEDQAADAVGAFLRVGLLLKSPEHVVQVEAVKSARLTYGVDFSPLLLSAPAQNNIRAEDEMLEPTELGKQLGMSAIATNAFLESHGLQQKIDGTWTPTQKADGMYVRHQWVRGNKSGYNYKWNVAKIKAIKENS